MFADDEFNEWFTNKVINESLDIVSVNLPIEKMISDEWVMVRDIAMKIKMDDRFKNGLSLKDYFKTLSMSDYEIITEKLSHQEIDKSLVNYVIVLLSLEDYKIVTNEGNTNFVLSEVLKFIDPLRRLLLEWFVNKMNLLKTDDNFRWSFFPTPAEMELHFNTVDVVLNMSDRIFKSKK